MMLEESRCDLLGPGEEVLHRELRGAHVCFRSTSKDRDVADEGETLLAIANEVVSPLVIDRRETIGEESHAKAVRAGSLEDCPDR
eukprot:10096290-Heterocapsa_arctica.AAC.1